MNLKLRLYRYTLLLCLLGGIAFLFHTPFFHSTPHPVTSYEEALQQFALVEKQESQLPLSKEGHSRLLVHGTKTDRVFVLLHGLTSCPEQCVALGTLFFNAGGNVIIPRAKDAGFADTMNKQQGNQSGQDLLDQAAIGLDIASGLGNKITLIGISAGGVSSAWMAQHRDGIDEVLLISPFFAPDGWPLPVMSVVFSLLAHIPNFYFWKNKSLKTHFDGPAYTYPRFGTQSIGSTLLLAKAVSVFDGPMKMKHLDILLTASDHRANNQVSKKLAKKWSQLNPEKINEYEFPVMLDIPHDSIDANASDRKIDLVYPKILEMLKIKNGIGLNNS